MGGRNGRKFVIWLLLIFAIAGGAALWLFQNKDKVKDEIAPEVLFSSFRVREFDRDRIDLIADIMVVNHAPVSFTTDRLKYHISVNGRQIAEGDMQTELTLAKDDTANVSLPITLMVEQLGKVLEHFRNSGADSADYRMRADVGLNVAVAGERTLKLDKSFRLPSFQLLDINPGKIHIDRFSLRKPELTIDVMIKNPNDYPVKMRDVAYRMKMEKALDVNGSIDGLTVIPPNDSLVVPCEVNVEKMNIPATAWKTLFDKDDTGFDVWFSSTVVSKNEMVDDSRMAFHMDGTLKELKSIK